LTEDDVLKKLEVSRQHAAEGKVRDADDMISDMRQKYGI
jgi:DNA-damage-inducible protein J